MHCVNSSVKLLRRRTEVNISVCCCNNLSRFEIFNKSYFGKLGHEVTISVFLLYMSIIVRGFIFVIIIKIKK